MAKHRFRHLPVFNDDSVVGMVAIADLGNPIINGQAQRFMNWKATLRERIPARRLL
jgi:predicted transcriptional regulator